jgi:predicted acetyltransferase
VSDVEIVNPVPVEEIPGWRATLSTTFFGTARGEQAQRRVENLRREWLPERSWGARAGGRWVGTLRTFPRTVTVPGCGTATADVQADALTSVTVNATHRRRGLLTGMLTQSLAAARERGDPFSVLIAAEWPIYGRFGYAPATREAAYTYFLRRETAKIPAAGAGSVRQVNPAEFGRLAPTIFDAARRGRAGQVDRREPWWPRMLGLDSWHLIEDDATPNHYVHEGPHGPDGLLAWTPVRDFDTTGQLAAIKVVDLVAVSGTGYRNLWAYLSGIDAVGEATLSMRPVDEPARWLLPDGRALRQTYTGDGMWLRLLDVPAALAARGYRVPGRLVIEVADPDAGGYGAGRYELDAEEQGASCRPSTRSADLVLSQRSLAGAYLGGFSLRELSPGGGVEENTPGALTRADAMFGTGLAPWNATGF